MQINIETALTILGTLGVGGIIGSFATFWLNKNQFKFERLHEKRAEVISELYKKLLNVRSAFGMSTFPDNLKDIVGPIDQRLKDADTASSDFSKYFSENRIYFDDSMEQHVENLSKVMGDLYFDIAEIKDVKQRDLEGASKKIKAELQPLIKKMEKEFKGIIGI